MSEPRPPRERALLDFLEGLCRRGIVPGGVAGIVEAGGLVWSTSFGLRATEPAEEPSSLETFWDLASLTKPLVTAALWLLLRGRGEADFASPVTEWVPELAAGPYRSPTVGELLVHAGGLPAWEPLYLEAPGGLSERAAWLARHREEPGRRSVYGCPGYQVLGLALERLTGRGLGELARAELWPGRDDLHFSLPPALAGRAAPTERGNVFERRLAGLRGQGWSGWRNELIRGQTHDLNAWSLGGAAGNAGLFATLEGLAALTATYLREGRYSALELEELSHDQVPESARGQGSERRSWGFQLARSESSCAGPALSARAFGHAGFTGTSLFVDPDRGAAYVLLTNRVHPEYREHPFHEERRRFHELAAGSREASRG